MDCPLEMIPVQPGLPFVADKIRAFVHPVGVRVNWGRMPVAASRVGEQLRHNAVPERRHRPRSENVENRVPWVGIHAVESPELGGSPLQMRVPETAVRMADGLELAVKLVGGVARGAGQDLPAAVGAPDICLPEPAKVYVEEGHEMGIGGWMV